MKTINIVDYEIIVNTIIRNGIRWRLASEPRQSWNIKRGRRRKPQNVMMDELIWVSETGDLYSSDRKQYASLSPDAAWRMYQCGGADKHLQISVTTENGGHVMCKVARIVADTWCPNRYNKPIAHHIDCNPQNNHPDNLLWVTTEEHSRLHSLRRKDEGMYYQYVNEIKNENQERFKEQEIKLFE